MLLPKTRLSHFSNLDSSSTTSSPITSAESASVEKLSIKEIGNELAYGAGLGVGLQLWCLQITGQYNWNLADFKKESLQGINIKQPDGVSLSLALMFGKNKDKVKKSKKQSSVADEDYEY